MSMRSQTHQKIRIGKDDQSPSIDIIQQTRRLVKGLDQKQRFQIAKKHLENALGYKAPRLDTYSSNVPLVFKACYNWQTSGIWQTFLIIISYIFMYLVIWAHQPPTVALISLQFSILLIMCIDVIMQIYHKTYQVLRFSSRFQKRFYLKVIVLILMVIDEILISSHPDWTIRPFLIFRSLLPILYDSHTRKAFQALLSAYKDILVFLFFYTCVIVGFGIVCHQIVQLPQNAGQDPFTNNYRQLDKTIFVLYVMSTYDAYPDNQLIAVRQSVYVYGFFVIFIFLNVFFFVTIPATIVFNSFRETRSKIILIDEIKQQHSLIMSFVSLGQQNLNITQNKLIQFLLYVYKNKVRYVGHISNICLKLDDNNNGFIQVNEYMQLCKILQSDTDMLPPRFYDWQKWLNFRSYVNRTFHLKQIVMGNKFKITFTLIIIFTFVNSCLSIYTQYKVFDIIDYILMAIFVLEIILKVIGLGPENFFKDPWNNLDFFLITTGLLLQFLPANLIPRNSPVLFKMTRIFRITVLVKLISEKNKLKSQIYIKATRLVSQIAIIIPIVLKFFPLFMITYYILGVMGMQIFRKSGIINFEDSPYKVYNEFSNFNTFIYSQFILVQVLVEAGWSFVAYDHAFKFGHYGLVMLFFVICHILIVIILSSLLKGITWQAYYTVHQQFTERTNQSIKQQINDQILLKKKQMIQKVKAQAFDNPVIIPDNLITKQLYQNKIDQQIMKKLRQIYLKNPQKRNRKQKNRSMISHLIQDRNIQINSIEQLQRRRKVHLSQNVSQDSIEDIMQSLNLSDVQDLTDEDIQQEMEKILSKIILHHKIQYSETIVYPKILTQFLEQKLQLPKKNFINFGFDIDKDVIANKESVEFLTYGLNVLLQIQVSQRQQKAMIINNMVRQGIISKEEQTKVLTKKLTDKDSSFDSNWIMRKAFLSDTNEHLIKKFEVQYFSSVYGKSFKQINKVTIQPLLRLESRLTYCLRNVLRYRQISQQQFFTILCTIQDTISNKLLKKGSLFKFVYQIDSVSDIWFSIELMESNELKIHFIKNGIWLYTRAMKPNEIRVAEDIFNWERISQRNDKSSCEKYIKMLYQSFESLAFCLNDQSNFFQSNPNKHIFDLFTCYKQVSQVERIKPRNISISKIMIVILSKEDQRKQPLDYDLTDLKFDQSQQGMSNNKLLFKFDQSQNQTYQKLKRMQLMDYDRIVQSQGIPFTYIINLISEIQDIIKLYQGNFIYQLEQLFNEKFDDIS